MLTSIYPQMPHKENTEYTSKLHEKSSENIMENKQLTVYLIFAIIHKFADSVYIFLL